MSRIKVTAPWQRPRVLHVSRKSSGITGNSDGLVETRVRDSQNRSNKKNSGRGDLKGAERNFLDEIYEEGRRKSTTHDTDEIGFLPHHAEMLNEPVSSGVPDVFTSMPLIRDILQTETSILQNETIEECLPFHSQSLDGLPDLERGKHVEFLHDSLLDLPSTFVAYDASRAWIIYWVLSGLTTLGEDISIYRERVVETLSAAQNLDGGFGSGHGQTSHCAPSYAAILSLAMIGGEESLKMIDRKSLWLWLSQIKQRDGSFAVSLGGEVDVRAYCSMVMVSLLGLPLELSPDAPARQAGLTSLTDGLPEWLSKCQTYEGGISASPGTEAHGGYAFCAVACLCILGEPRQMLHKYLDIASLISWMSARQYAPEGGFSGRTNKLVDGCYSHWVGGCWPFIEAALELPENSSMSSQQHLRHSYSLHSRDGLQLYILCCCQSPEGGLRDKPTKRPDAYHTCYGLAGLSSAQHRYIFRNESVTEKKNLLTSAFRWSQATSDANSAQMESQRPVGTGNIVEPVHPVFVIPFAAVERARSLFSETAGL